MNAIQSVIEEPKLAPPGAGLPGVELFVARVLFKWRLATHNRQHFDEGFSRERGLVRRLISGCDAETGARRVLIDRLRGLEDSSRYWSVWMTLDQLRIVQVSIARTIGQLLSGKVPAGKASTAAVKPSPNTTIEIIPEYEASCDAVVKAAGDVTGLKTKARYAHPWFGPLDAAGWHALAAGHFQIHRKQIEKITEAC